MAEQVVSFISRFKSLSPSGDVVDVFTKGCCYWFAYILSARFKGTLMYDSVANHFATEIGGRIYDISGDVTDKYSFIRWQDFDTVFHDPNELSRIKDYCILFTK